MREKINFCRAIAPHFNLSGNKQEVKVFCDRVPVHLQVVRDIRDAHAFRLELKEVLYPRYLLLVEDHYIVIRCREL